MTSQNSLNFSDPLHILYLAAEGTFLRMMERSGGLSTGVRARRLAQMQVVGRGHLPSAPGGGLIPQPGPHAPAASVPPPPSGLMDQDCGGPSASQSSPAGWLELSPPSHSAQSPALPSIAASNEPPTQNDAAVLSSTESAATALSSLSSEPTQPTAGAASLPIQPTQPTAGAASLPIQPTQPSVGAAAIDLSTKPTAGAVGSRQHMRERLALMREQMRQSLNLASSQSPPQSAAVTPQLPASATSAGAVSVTTSAASTSRMSV